ncbi:MAG: hypothetical protein EXS16_15850 [Gemmataceae bacterium]|nr:hypothetical protein [Gemmataceae bacterium]
MANDGENAWLVLALTMATITLSATCALLLARSFADTDRGVSPFVLFAYYFLGRLVGTLSYPFFIEPMFALQSQVYGIVATLLVTVVAFLGLSAWQTVPGPMEAKQNISNAWLRYARWFVLGGLPVCVASGATDYIATEISPIPVMWLVPLSLYVASFVVAFSRMARPASALHMAIPQFLVAIALLAPACWLLWSLSERLIDSELAVMSAVVGLAIAGVLMPHRATLVVQCLLVAIIVMQIYGGQPIHAGSSFGVMWHLATHVLCSAVISWGCIGDAVGEAQDGDRLAEFLVCIHAGAVVYGFAYQKILPILIPPDWGLVEYPVVLVGSLAVRAWVLYGRANLVGNS